MTDYAFDRYLRYDELAAWIDALAAAHPDLVEVETYGRSYEGRDLYLVTVTDSATGAHDTKPAHWIDASIHAVELTATVAACRVLQHLVERFRAGDPTTVRALSTRTFYVVPRVNPDGAEWVLADRPRFRRSSVRPWPYPDVHRWPGLHPGDIDGDGRILQMRWRDEDGPWMPHPDDARLMVPVPPAGVDPDTPRYRLLEEGDVVDFDGFTVPGARDPEGLDLNRNFPAGWSTKVTGSGDHPLSEPEIDALVRAIVARPNICGFNAFHTSAGVILRPSSTKADSTLPPDDVWVYGELGRLGTELTGYPAHSVFEDYTWDRSDTMSGASDDWVYEHLGIYGWTTEFWDPILAATGEKQSTHIWYTGPTDAEQLAVLRWVDGRPAPADPRHAAFVDWYAFDHPQLGAVELGGWNDLESWTNPPLDLLAAEVDRHVDFAVAQALAAPCIAIRHTKVEALGDGVWRVTAGVANTGWLPTDVSAVARRDELVGPIVAELVAGHGAAGDTAADAIDVEAPARRTLGQLAGSMAARFTGSTRSTPDRTTCSWVVHAPAGAGIEIVVRHPRAGTARHRSVLTAP